MRARDLLRVEGPHAPATVKRRLAQLGRPCIAGGRDGPFASPALRAALRLAVRAAARPRRRKSQRAVTRDVLEQLLATCGSDRLADSRDAALLLVAFASGGRRRSEIAEPARRAARRGAAGPADPADPNSPALPCLSIVLGRTKTAAADEDARVLLVGPPVEALREWLVRADIAKGPVFRAIDRWGGLEDRALTPQAVNLIVKRRVARGRPRPEGLFARMACARAI